MTALPPLPLIELALAQATEYFAAELLHPSSQVPDWTDFEWAMARAAAVMHGVTPLLAGVLRWHGPCAWEAFVSQQRQHTALRQQRIETLLARIDGDARRAGIAIVALKGAALHRLKLYSSGERPMADLDLLVAPSDTERTKQLLQTLDYLDTSVSWKHRVFEPTASAIGVPRKAAASFGEHAERAIKIELHTRIAERLPLNTVDVSALVYPAAPVPGLNNYPSTLALLTHLLLHAAGSMVIRALRLLQLHDLALLSARIDQDDWGRLLALRVEDRSLWWAVPPLELVARYYPRAVPAEVIAALRPGCPRSLRGVSRRHTISQVSLSTLRMEAFPGIAWSASMSDKLSYVISRVIPNRELVETPVVVKAKEGWAAHSSWSQLSHRRRMMKWVLERPPRPPAIHTVHCAMQEPAIYATSRPPPVDENRGAVRTP
ncbi:MAG TPA: nucleotidyltransferase family protein [Steroidobacteraceae bacterium]